MKRRGTAASRRGGLETCEEVLEEAVAVTEFVVGFNAAFGENRVREVIVFVDENEELEAGSFQANRNLV